MEDSSGGHRRILVSFLLDVCFYSAVELSHSELLFQNGRGDDHGNANGESHEAPLLGPPPSPSPSPPMTLCRDDGCSS